MPNKRAPGAVGLECSLKGIRILLAKIPGHEIQIGPNDMTLWQMEPDATKSVSGWEAGKFTSSDELIAHINTLTNKKAA